MLLKCAVWGIAYKDSCSSFIAVCYEAGKHIKFAVILMYLWCPKLCFAPKTVKIAENLLWLAPIFQVIAYIDIKAKLFEGLSFPSVFGSCAVHIVFIVMRKDKGVSNIYFASFHFKNTSITGTIVFGFTIGILKATRSALSVLASLKWSTEPRVYNTSLPS